MTQTGGFAAPAFGRREAKAGNGADIIDADYVIVGKGNAAAPVVQAAKAPVAPRQPVHSNLDSADADGMGMLRPSDAQQAQTRNDPGSPVFWAVGALFVATAFWISGGHHVMRALAQSPQAPVRVAAAAKPVARDLKITAFNSFVDPTGVRPQLVVSGQAINDGKEVTNLPAIEIQVTSGNGAMTRYTLGTGGAALLPGDSFPFSGRLDAPQAGVKSVSFDFK